MSTLTVNFTNSSNIPSGTTISIGFLAGQPAPGQAATPFNITNNNTKGPSISPLDNGTGPYPYAGNWYTLDDLSKGVTISSFSGRIYVCYGTTWTLQYAGYEPGQAVTDPNFFLRYDKMEMTFTGSPNDVADLTSIDYWSIPMTLNTYLSTSKTPTTPVQTVYGLKTPPPTTANPNPPTTTALSLYTVLNNLTTPPVAGGAAGPGGVDGSPMPALVPGKFLTYPAGNTPPSAFARIIGPSSYPPILPLPGSIPVMPYDFFTDYLSYLYDTFGPGTSTKTITGLGNGVIALLSGQFGGVGSPPPATGPQSKQTYNLSAYININRDIILSGTVSGVSGTTTMLYTNASLVNATGIYGGNAPFYLNGSINLTSPANDVYGWIGGDLFSGFAIGALGSQTKVDINGKTQMVGGLTSQNWFGISPSLFFSGLQPKNSNYYNQWAATLAPLSDAYNFAFTDRFAAVFASLNPATVDTLEIVLDDTTGVM